HVHGKRVVLEYTVDETRVLDSSWLETRGDLRIFTRSLELAPCKHAMKLVVSASSNGVTISAGPRLDRAIVQLQKAVLAVATLGDGVHLANENNKLIVEFAARDTARRVKILFWSGPEEHLPKFDQFAGSAVETEDFAALISPAPPHWLP